MTQLSDIVLLAIVLVAVVCIALLARSFVRLTSWLNRRQAEAQQRAREAEERADSLLREVMDEQEYLQLSERRYVDVQSPHTAERVYRVHLQRNQAVDVFESGWLVARLCVHPTGQLPEPDVLLSHKLMIEANEEEYLREANVFATAT